MGCRYMTMMVMKRPTPRLARARRLGVAQAKAKLSEAVRRVAEGPIVIHNRGRDVAVLVGMDQFERSDRPDDDNGGQTFLSQLERLKARYGGGVEDFAPATLQLTASAPFARGGKRR